MCLTLGTLQDQFVINTTIGAYLITHSLRELSHHT